VLALASGFFGLAFGARVDMLPLALLLVATYVALLRADLLADRAARRGAALALAAPFLACLVAYAAYNSARFGSPLQLGYRYQLSTGHTGRPHPSPRNIVPGLWYYLFAPPHWRLQFPFFWPPPPPPFWGPAPPWYGPVEKVAGLLPSAPIVLALPAAAMAAAGRRRRPLRDLAWPVALLCVTALSITLFIAYAAATATMRYAADFTTLVLLAALLVWFRALPRRRSTRRFRRGAVVTIGTLLGLYGLLVGTAFSLIGSRDQLAATRPQTFRTLERLFSPLPTAAAMVVGHPLVVAVNGDPTLTPWGYDHVSLDGTAFQVGLTAVYVQVASPRRGVFHLEARLTRAPGVHGRGTVRVGVSANQTGAYVTVAGAPAYFGILLSRGINQVRVETAADIPRVRPATDGSLAGLADLRVR
jgi:hypothetical protein